MCSKRSKKSKQEIELLSEKNNLKPHEPSEQGMEPEVVNTVENNGALPNTTPIPKPVKRKKKTDGGEGVAKKRVRKTNLCENGVQKLKVKKGRPKSTNLNNSQVVSQDGVIQKNEQISPETKNSVISPSLAEKKRDITWPNEDVSELINRIESNIPEKDDLAYKSRVEKLQWENVAFKDYSPDDCKKTWLQVQKRIRRFRLLREILNDAKEWVNAPKPNFKVPRRKKHPDMPRRPLSSYLLFYLKKKDEIISENPGLDGSDISKIVGQIYKNLPAEIREQYEKLAASNKEEYLEKLKVFFETHPEYVPPQRSRGNHKNEKDVLPKNDTKKLPLVEKTPTKVETVPAIKIEKPSPTKTPQKPEQEKITKSGKPKSLNKAKSIRPLKENGKGERKPGRPPKGPVIERPPKRCQTAFGLFYATQSKNMEAGTDKSAFKEKCKLEYKQMPDTQKVYWINLAEQDLIRYQEEIKVYKAKYPDFKMRKIRTILTKRERASKERAAGKPKKPPNSAYALFSKVMLQSLEIKSVHPKDRMNYIASKWKTCTKEEQDSYKNQVVITMDKYRQDYKAYIDNLPEEEKRKLVQQNKRKKKSGRQSGRIGKIRRPRKRKVQTPRAPKTPKSKFTEPEQPPISACKYFVSLYKGEGDPTQAWKALSSEEKRKYEEELVKKKQEYIVEFEKFLKSLSKEELEAFSKSRQQVQPQEEDSSECSSGSDDDAGSDDSNDNDDLENEDTNVNNDSNIDESTKIEQLQNSVDDTREPENKQ